MDFVAWNEKFSVSVDSIDDQHRKLFGIINRLNESVKTKALKNTINELISELEAYTRVHFSAEERIWAKHNYPDIISHKKMHKYFTDEIANIKSSFSQDIFSSTPQSLLNFLRDWLIQHILGEDKKIKFLVQNQ
jgi:hemerythrin-like metal-binding protein